MFLVLLFKIFMDNLMYLDIFNLNLKMISVFSILKGSEQVSELIKYKVVSIDEMFDVKYWQVLEDIVDGKFCL